MIKKYITGYAKLTTALIVFLSIIISIKYLDTGIAVSVMHFLLSIRPLRKATENIPDILAYLVLAGTLIMWVIYFARWRNKRIDKETKFLQLAASALPAAYAIKTFFQFVFGRTNIRTWLLIKKPLEFNWFHGLGSSSFPSGHMTVFAAFGTAILLYYPQYLKQVLILLILLGIALIGTGYHYLSDVIAGAYLGMVTTYSIRFILKKH
jgi:membrane-associated phospholipid phosphatase